MKNIWVLSVRTSLPELGYTPADIAVTFKAYDTFEKGRDAMRDVIKNYAYNKNSMFDGEGNITYLKKYWEEMWDEEYIDDGPCNGYDPDIRTNIFSMKQEQEYYLYINDLLGQDDFSSELYIDLKKVTIQK